MQRSLTTFRRDSLVLLRPLVGLPVTLGITGTIDSDNHTTATDYSPTAATTAVVNNTIASPSNHSFIAAATTPSVASVPRASS